VLAGLDRLTRGIVAGRENPAPSQGDLIGRPSPGDVRSIAEHEMEMVTDGEHGCQEPPNNPDPTRLVTFGEQTNDEMLIGYMDVAIGDQDLTIGPPKVIASANGKFDVTIRHRPSAGSKTVHLAASFKKDYSPCDELNGLSAEGLFTTTVIVPAGLYQYKYVHHGTKYRHDPAN
jgi:hypothetical protein